MATAKGRPGKSAKVSLSTRGTLAQLLVILPRDNHCGGSLLDEPGITFHLMMLKTQTTSRKDAEAPRRRSCVSGRLKTTRGTWDLTGRPGVPLTPCVKKVARRSRRRRNVLLGHELICWTPVPLFSKIWHGGSRDGGTVFKTVLPKSDGFQNRPTQLGAEQSISVCSVWRKRLTGRTHLSIATSTPRSGSATIPWTSSTRCSGDIAGRGLRPRWWRGHRGGSRRCGIGPSLAGKRTDPGRR